MSTLSADLSPPSRDTISLSLQGSPGSLRTLPFETIVATVATLGLLFQIGHFFEHAVQFTVWLLGDLSNICGRDTPWMSPWVTEAVRVFGVWAFPTAAADRQMMLGMEFLHLIANFIFLSSLICLYYCVPSKWVRWACYIEGFHLYEHIMLTASAYFIGKPIGLSTLFGGSAYFGSREFAVGYRVMWHFLLNLFPMPLAMIAIMEDWREKGRTYQYAQLIAPFIVPGKTVSAR